jgi:hypothetical protein
MIIAAESSTFKVYLQAPQRITGLMRVGEFSQLRHLADMEEIRACIHTAEGKWLRA